MFTNKELANQGIERISARCNRAARNTILRMFERIPMADSGLARFERILEAVNSPGMLMTSLEENVTGARLLGLVLGTSHHLADILIQNPEFVYEIVSPLDDDITHSIDEIEAEGARLLSATTSFSHKMDRLRFLKQKYFCRLATVDLGDLMEQRLIWERISNVTLALINLAKEIAWEQVQVKSVSKVDCPIMIVCQGKLGGKELNYSSDVDLSFVLPDDLPEELEKPAAKWAELFRSVMSDRMGRGELFRVDLRLRPFGSQGPILNKMSAVESYYAGYAEEWEHLALLRSLCLGGTPEMRSRWQDMRQTIVFRGPRSEATMDRLIKMRARLEDITDESDLKRGAGGIRDVEFVTQIMQMQAGQNKPELQTANTLEALDHLLQAELLSADMHNDLSDAYTFLRQVEHRCQIIGGLQTHSLPDDPGQQMAIAFTLHMKTASSLESRLSHIRHRVRSCYDQILGSSDPKELIYSPDLVKWITGLEGASGFFKVLKENRDSLERMEKVVQLCPVLIPDLQKLVTVTEQVISGEIIEGDTEVRFEAKKESAAKDLGQAFRRARTRAAIRAALDDPTRFGKELSGNLDAILEILVNRVGGDLTIAALGSYAARESSLSSDGDIVLFANDSIDPQEAEVRARAFIKEIQAVRRENQQVEFDFRLRPEGKAGRLAPTRRAFIGYRRRFMETWERFACGRARIVVGDQAFLKEFQQAAYEAPISSTELDDLQRMKSRIENERVNPTLKGRQIKLGPGGIDDITWAAQLWLMKHPWLGREASAELPARLETLTSAGLITILERDMLTEAWQFFVELRLRMYLQGATDDLVPENPARLEAIADGMGLADANAALAKHETHRTEVREFFDETWERLRK